MRPYYLLDKWASNPPEPRDRKTMTVSTRKRMVDAQPVMSPQDGLVAKCTREGQRGSSLSLSEEFAIEDVKSMQSRGYPAGSVRGKEPHRDHACEDCVDHSLTEN